MGGEDQRVKIDWSHFQQKRQGGRHGGGGWVGEEKTTCENRTSLKRRKGVGGQRWERQRETKGNHLKIPILFRYNTAMAERKKTCMHDIVFRHAV